MSPSSAALLTERGLLDDLNKVTVRWNGITWPDQAAAFRREVRAPGPLRVMSLARLVPRKNVDKCILAVARLVNAGVDIRYTVCGRGPELEHLQRLAEENLPPGVVRFAGYVPDADVPRLYKDHDVFLHPHSHRAGDDEFEGFGIVIADAMSFACAVIAGRDGGPGDYITDGETGLLVDGDDIDVIAAALREFADDDVKCRRVASRGQRLALRDFTWASHVDGLADVR